MKNRSKTGAQDPCPASFLKSKIEIQKSKMFSSTQLAARRSFPAKTGPTQSKLVQPSPTKSNHPWPPTAKSDQFGWAPIKKNPGNNGN
jgi:hypothetical protein